MISLGRAGGNRPILQTSMIPQKLPAGSHRPYESSVNPRAANRYGRISSEQGASAVLGDVERPAECALTARPAHQYNRVGIRKNAAFSDRMGEQVRRA